MIFNTGLTHLGSEASNFLCCENKTFKRGLSIINLKLGYVFIDSNGVNVSFQIFYELYKKIIFITKAISLKKKGFFLNTT